MHIEIYSTDTALDIARKLFNDIEVGGFVTIGGFVRNEEKKELMPKGEAVVVNLIALDELWNCPNKKRKFVYQKGTIGGPIAHKVFKYEIRVVDSEPRYTIWRLQ